MNAPPPKLLLFGGSFDPPHMGHVLVAHYAMATTPAEALWVIPTFSHPFGKPLTPFAHRLKMCELAMQTVPRVTVSRIEEALGGTSFTARTLETVHERMPDHQLTLILGADAARDIEGWQEPEKVLALASLFVVNRAQNGRPAPPADAVAFPDISSSDIRQRLREGARVGHLMAHSVREYIRTHRLYAAGKSAARD